MTDAELRDAAVAELKGTTVGYTYFTKKGTVPGPNSRWGKALAYLDQIGQAPPPPPPPPPSASKLGVYRGAANPAGVDAFAAWVPASVTYGEDFLAGNDWSKIESPDWWLQAWQGKGYTMVYGVPLIPDTGGSLAEGASGAYNFHFAKLAQKLVDYNQGDAILRLGWEFGGGWYRWAVRTPQDATNFAAYWRNIVETMRAVAPGLRFDFNGIWGWQAVSPADAYPGDGFVDFIGCDVYDQSWVPNYTDPAARWQDFLTAQYGGEWWASFAASRGKPLSIPEWGVAERADGHGGGDCPSFIDNMADWMAAKGVAYHVYFEFDAPDGKHRLMTGQFPQAAERFRARFG